MVYNDLPPFDIKDYKRLKRETLARPFAAREVSGITKYGRVVMDHCLRAPPSELQHWVSHWEQQTMEWLMEMVGHCGGGST